MAAIATFLSKPPSLLPSIYPKLPEATSTSAASVSFRSLIPRRHRLLGAAPLQATAAPNAAATTSRDERVQLVHSVDEFDAALRAAGSRLVVVEYAARHSPHSRRIYPFMVELSRTCADVIFLLVMGDDSDAARELCRRENIEKVPHFSFYKSLEKVHEEEGIGPDELVGDVLYYGDSHSEVVQLHSRGEVEKLIGENSGTEGKLVVLDVGLKHCGPCVKVYPTVLKLSRSMAGSVVFARMNGDENESCMGFLRDMGVVEVPTFLFVKNGEVRGRYVGSGKGELIGEILRYQGVRVT